MDYDEPRLPCDATQIGRFRRLLGEDGLAQLFKATIECAVDIKAVRPADLERVVVDSTVQSKAIAHPVDSRLLEIARHKVVSAAKRAGIACKQTCAKEGKTLRRKAGGYAHAKQFKRLRKTVERQRTILGVVMREVQRKLGADQAAVAAGGAPANEPGSPKALSDLAMWLERAERIRTQQRNTKKKLYALHAPEMECISKGKARNPCEFGVKVSLVVTHKQGLMVGARSFAGNPNDGHVLNAQIEQTSNLLRDVGRSPKQVIVDLCYRGVDADNPRVQIIHRGKYKSFTDHERRLLKRRQAIEPLVGHTKADHRMDRCWLQGAMGDALHALSCAAGCNIRWLLRAIVRLGFGGLFYALSAVIACLACLLQAMPAWTTVTQPALTPKRRPSAHLPAASVVAVGRILQGRLPRAALVLECLRVGENGVAVLVEPQRRARDARASRDRAVVVFSAARDPSAAPACRAARPRAAAGRPRRGRRSAPACAGHPTRREAPGR